MQIFRFHCVFLLIAFCLLLFASSSEKHETNNIVDKYFSFMPGAHNKNTQKYEEKLYRSESRDSREEKALEGFDIILFAKHRIGDKDSKYNTGNRKSMSTKHYDDHESQNSPNTILTNKVSLENPLRGIRNRQKESYTKNKNNKKNALHEGKGNLRGKNYDIDDSSDESSDDSSDKSDKYYTYEDDGQNDDHSSDESVEYYSEEDDDQNEDDNSDENVEYYTGEDTEYYTDENDDELTVSDETVEYYSDDSGDQDEDHSSDESSNYYTDQNSDNSTEEDDYHDHKDHKENSGDTPYYSNSSSQSVEVFVPRYKININKTSTT